MIIPELKARVTKLILLPEGGSDLAYTEVSLKVERRSKNGNLDSVGVNNFAGITVRTHAASPCKRKVCIPNHCLPLIQGSENDQREAEQAVISAVHEAYHRFLMGMPY